jgi:methionyl-tRNA synthetase
VDAVRYFLLRDMSFGLDSGYTTEAVVARQNSDLANDLGNLFSRSLTMVKKFSGGKVPEPGTPEDIDKELAEAAREMVLTYQQEMDAFSFHKALQAIWDLVSRANKYIVATEPWELAKDSNNSSRLDTVFYYLLESLRLIAMTVQPIMPDTARKMGDALSVNFEGNISSMGQWGKLQPGTEIKRIKSLFPRLDLNEMQKEAQPEKQVKKKKEQEKVEGGLIGFEEFTKLDLRVGEIVAAEKIKKSDRLLKLTVKAPEERTIVAGIAEHYQPEDVVGRQVIIVANLKPAKLMGVLSQGMVLAARDGDKLLLSGVTDMVAPGSKVS